MPRKTNSKKHTHLKSLLQKRWNKGECQLSSNEGNSEKVTSTPVSVVMMDIDSDSSIVVVGDEESATGLVDLNNSCISDDLSLTRTEKKLLLCASTTPEPELTSDGNIVVELTQQFSLICSFPCPKCFQPDCLKPMVKSRMGLASQIAVNCELCAEEVLQWWSSTRGLARVDDDDDGSSSSSREAYNVNKLSVYASISNGMGAVSFNNFSANFDINGMHHKSFHAIADKFYGQNPDIRKFIFGKVSTIVRREHSKKLSDSSLMSPDKTLDLTVSFDGSWLTRGHTSLLGLGCVIDSLTGLVLDVLVMSSSCEVCNQARHMKETDPDAYNVWIEYHLGSGKCNNKYHGTYD